MAYISSNANRFYTALEGAYGQVPTVTARNRIPAAKLSIKQQLEVIGRKDKTGSRTFAGLPIGGRKQTSFELQTFLTNWQQSASGPSYGPLFQAALGAAPAYFAGGTAATSTGSGRLGFASPHGLEVGQAVSSGGEIRFVAAIVDANNVQLNVPFTVPPAAGASVGAAITYTPATELPSVGIFDYWSPTTATQRLLCGGAVDQMAIDLNGDYHEFRFSGQAQDVVDSSSGFGGGTTGASQLASFPAEPTVGEFDYTIVPGNLGQAWLGTSPTQFFTITAASVVLKNGLDMRTKEFGSSLPMAIAPGERTVTAAFDLYSGDDAYTQGLYQAARQQSPISVMFQMGETLGQLVGVYLQSVIPVVPEFDDGKNRLQWKFRQSRAQGTVDNEISVAFG
jgi:hypothetical protein